jgi:hypothetical protein
LVADSCCSVECRNWASVVGASSNSVTQCTMRATGEAAWYAWRPVVPKGCFYIVLWTAMSALTR